MASIERKYQEPLFPAPFEHFENIIAENIISRQKLELELIELQKNYKRLSTYKLDYQMPGFSNGGPSKNYDFAIETLQKQIKEVENKIDTRIEREIKELELNKNDTKLIREVVYEKMFPDPFKDKSPSEIKTIKMMPKTIEESQRIAYYELKKVKRDNFEKESFKVKSKNDLSPDKD